MDQPGYLIFNTIELMLLQCRRLLALISSKLPKSSDDKRPRVGEVFVKFKGLSSTFESRRCRRTCGMLRPFIRLSNSVEAETECLARGN